MQYFAVAVASLVLAEGILTTKWASPLANIGNAGVLVAVHLTTIGFLTLVMLGALHQFVPVLTKKDLAYPVLSGFTLILVSLGLFGMIAGFLALPGTVPGGIFPPIPWILPMGGALVVVGVVLAVMNMWVTMGRAWPWTLSTWFVASGLFFVMLTVLAGLFLALSLAVPTWFTPQQVQVMGGRGLAAHVVGGVAGWLTLTAMGVSYKLFAMFTLSEERQGLWGWTAYVATSIGIMTVWVARWLGTNVVAQVGWFLILLGLVSYLWDMRVLFRQRKRRHLELNTRYAVIPLGFLVLVVLGGLLVRLGGMVTRWDIALAFLAVYGWLGGLVLTQLYKIVPFLTWLTHFGTRLGTGRPPRVQELVNESRDHYAFLLYFAAIAVGTVSLGWGWTGVFRGAMFAAEVATCDIGRALYHGAHPRKDQKSFAVF